MKSIIADWIADNKKVFHIPTGLVYSNESRIAKLSDACKCAMSIYYCPLKTPSTTYNGLVIADMFTWDGKVVS